MTKKYARGHAAWGECARSGRRMLLRDMVFDGQFPNLRVDPAWFEPKHPQEQLKRVDDPVALWRPAPENLQNTPPVLTAVLFDGPGLGDAYIDVDWTAAESGVSMITGYDLYRSVNLGSFELFQSWTIERDMFGGIVDGEVLAWNDTDVDPGSRYDYYVIAHAVQGGDVQSNTAGAVYEDIEYQATPPVLSITQVDGSQPIVSLAWTASTIHNGTIDHYELFRRDQGDEGDFTSIADIPGDTLVYDDTDVEGGPGYEYYVVARVTEGIDSENSNTVETGFIFTGIIVTDMRFNTAPTFLLDSAEPGLIYTARPIGTPADQPKFDSGRMSTADMGAWFFGAARSDLRSDNTALVNLNADWTWSIDLQTELTTPLGGFPTPVACSVGSASGDFDGMTIEQSAHNGVIRVTVQNNGVTTTISSSVVALINNSYSVVVTRTGNTVRLYVDGELEATDNTVVMPSETDMRFTLAYTNGNNAGNDLSRWRGWLDNMRFIQDQAVPPT